MNNEIELIHVKKHKSHINFYLIALLIPSLIFVITLSFLAIHFTNKKGSVAVSTSETAVLGEEIK